MSKNTIYLMAAIVALIIIAIIWSPKPPLELPTASPANGLPSSTSAPAAAPAPAPAAAPSPESAATQPPKDKAMDADDVPAGAEVAPAPAPTAPKPAEDKGLVIPPSEGQ